MRKPFIILFLINSMLSCQQPESKKQESQFDEVAETAAIMKVIENETKCFFEGNYECWASNWSHES